MANKKQISPSAMVDGKGGLSVVYLKTSDLIPYINNSRTHSDEQVAQVAASIKEFGFTNPILIDEDGGIIAGHGRLLAAKKLKLDNVPTITLEGLTDAQRKAYIIADNKLALNAGWDFEVLAMELGQLKDLDFNIDIIGFDSNEMIDILGDVNFSPSNEDEQGKLDELDPKWIECPHCSKTFNERDL